MGAFRLCSSERPPRLGVLQRRPRHHVSPFISTPHCCRYTNQHPQTHMIRNGGATATVGPQPPSRPCNQQQISPTLSSHLMPVLCSYIQTGQGDRGKVRALCMHCTHSAHDVNLTGNPPKTIISDQKIFALRHTPAVGGGCTLQPLETLLLPGGLSPGGILLYKAGQRF